MVVLYVFIKNIIKRKTNLLLPRNQLIWIGGLLVLYPFFNYIILKTAEWYYFSYFVAVFILYFGFTIGFYNKLLNREKIKKVLIFIALSEIVISFLQYFNLLPHNKYFSVNGTCSNPNFTAVYLVMVLPMVIDIVKQYKNKFLRILSITVIIVIFALSLYLLKSRTAFVGFFICVGFLLFSYLTKNRLVSKKVIFTGVILSIIVIGFLIPKFYNFKKESADGRLLVWKISSQVITHKPITGYGYGKTQYAYNVAQAKYFRDQKATETEKQNAGYISNVLNDYLEIWIQGGLLGLFILSFFLYRLLTASYKQKHPYLFISMLMFVLMLFFNVVIYFAFTAIIFAFYASEISVDIEQKQNIKIPKVLNNGFVVVFCLVFIFISVQGYSQTQLKKSKDSLINEDFIRGRKYLNKSSRFIATSEFFHNISGDIYMREKKYNQALKEYYKAYKYAPNPKLATKMAVCYINLNDEKKAFSKLYYAVNHTPSLFRPYYILMSMYSKQGNKQKTIETANIIINKNIKIDSEEVLFYKNKALEILKSYQNENKK